MKASIYGLKEKQHLGKNYCNLKEMQAWFIRAKSEATSDFFSQTGLYSNHEAVV